MLVSVVIPVYKVEKYLRQCLDSVLAQTYRDLEIVVVDDGSPDGCPAIIDEYASKDPRVVAVHQPNGGYGKAVNTGIAVSKGRYVGIVESDDWIEPDMYERLVESIERTGADLARCTFSIFDGTKDFLWDEVVELNRRDGDVIHQHDEPDYFLYHSAPWSYLYRRELFDDIRLSESKGASYQDVTLVAEALLTTRSVAIVGRPLLHYRMENGQGSSCTGGGRNLMNIIDRCVELRDFMEERGFRGSCMATMLVKKSVRAVNWFYERINEEFRPEFFDRLSAFFRSFFVSGVDVSWDEIPLTERAWVWTVLTGRIDLSHPVLLQQPDPESRAEEVMRVVMDAMAGPDADVTARLFGAVEPAFPDTPNAILFAANRKYLPYLSVAVSSVLENATDTGRYDMIVFVDFDLDLAERIKFGQMVRGRGNASLRFFDIRRHFTMPYFRSLFVDRHLSLATYYRFAAPYVLWNYKKCLWLDCDVVVCENPTPLMETDLEGYQLAGCRDLAVTSGAFPMFVKSIDYLKSLGYTHAGEYICAGVMLFNLTAMRGAGTVPKLLKACAAHEFRMHDQDGINLVCQGEILLLEDKWDFIAHDSPGIYSGSLQPWIADEMARRRGIWHFAGDAKPWHRPWKECSFVWWRYARHSPYYEELVMDMTMTASGVPRNRSLEIQYERERAIQRGKSDPTERKIKYFLPYGFMCRYLRRRYGFIIDKPLFSTFNPFLLVWRMIKFFLPYGLVLKLTPSRD